MCPGFLNCSHWLYSGTISLAVNVNIYHGCNVNYILILCVHYICHLGLCTCCEAINPLSGLWRSVYSDVRPGSAISYRQQYQNLLFSHRVCRLFCCAAQGVLFYCCPLWLEATPGRSNTRRFVFTQISELGGFLCRGPQEHQGGWHSPLFR